VVVVVVVGVASAEVAGAEVAFSLLPHATAVGITSTASSATITARVFMREPRPVHACAVSIGGRTALPWDQRGPSPVAMHVAVPTPASMTI